jgi:hypothetical protein
VLHPSDFDVDEAWLVIKASPAPMRTDEDGDFDVYVLQDAASMFIFGTVMVPVGSRTGPEDEFDALLQDAGRQRRRGPGKILFAHDDPAMRSFAAVTARAGVSVEFVEDTALDFYTNDVQSGFAEHFGR